MKVFFLVVVPVVEIIAAALVAHLVGWGWTLLALVVLSGFGAWQLKVQGLAAWRTAGDEVRDGVSPAPAVLDGVVRLLGAVLLTAPGFVSALVGAALLVRPARRVVARNAGQWIVTRLRVPFVVVSDGGAAGWRFRGRGEPDIVDVEGWEDSPSETQRPTPPALTPGSSRY